MEDDGEARRHSEMMTYANDFSAYQIIFENEFLFELWNINTQFFFFYFMILEF